MLIKPCYDFNSNKHLSCIGQVFNKLQCSYNKYTDFCKRFPPGFYGGPNSALLNKGPERRNEGEEVKVKMNFKRKPERNFSLIALKQILNIKT